MISRFIRLYEDSAIILTASGSWYPGEDSNLLPQD